MKVIVINQYCENRGDEAAGTALVRNLLGKPKIDQIDIIYNSANKLDIDHPKILHRNEELRLKKIGKLGILRYLLLRKTVLRRLSFANETMREMARTISEADVIYVTPCGASLGIYKDWAFLLRLLFVISENKTPVFCLNTINASGNILFDFLAKLVLRKSKVYVREQRSVDYLKSIQVKSELGVDTAFSEQPIIMERDPKRIGLVVTLLEWHPEFTGRNMSQEVIENIVPGIAQYCIENEYEIELIPHTGQQDETEYIQEVIRALEDNGMLKESLIFRKDVNTSDEYDLALASKRFVVGMRYHSIVLAAKNAVPFVALAYENKMKEVCKYTNSMESYLNLQEVLTSEDVYKKMKLVDDKLDIIKENLISINQEKLQILSRLPLKEIQ
ncbi:polysaccharide pyruvyl transferase family protein [Streptococcus caprae]|uniref:Polysaccharide pyruvyl transferase family protein n=1 Tax=Streptococcus caprae TaxID=1640501 RepID=A0ABV8CUK8_9STRE